MAQTAGLSRVDLLHGHPTRIVGLLVILAAGAVALLLWLAFSNHRSAERDTTRVIRQAVFVAAFLTAGVALFTGL
jgi:uncharacterized membrane protein YhiD involved in acid resistance